MRISRPRATKLSQITIDSNYITASYNITTLGLETINKIANYGAFYLKDVTVRTADVTITYSDIITLCNATGGAFTVTLPNADDAGAILIIKKIDSSANVITIDAVGTQTIDGALTYSLSVQYQSVTIISDGSNWHII